MNQQEDRIEWVDAHEPGREPDPVARLDDLVWRGEARWSDRVAVQFRDRSWTFHEMAERVRSIASGLEEMGVERGDSVVILGENSPHWLMLYFGVVAIGACAVPLEPDRSEEGLRRAVRLTEPAAGFIKPDLIDRSLWEEYIGENLFKLDRSGEGVDEAAGAITGTFPREEGKVSDVASILFTSGTTGQAKGVCLTHKNFTAELDGLYQLGYFEQDDRFLSLLPMYHAYEFMGGQMMPMYAGATIVYAEELTSTSVLRHLKEDGITLFLGVPLLFQKLAEKILKARSEMGVVKRSMFETLRSVSSRGGWFGSKARSKLRDQMASRGFKDLRMMVSGGAPLNPEIAELFINLGIPLIQGYGMTELSPVVTVNLPDSPESDSVGKSLPNARVGIREPDKDGLGEIVVSGPMVFERYLHAEESPTEPFPTGDIGRIRDGELIVEGRKKYTIVTAEGKNIFPEQVEEVYGQSAYIEEILVVGQERSDASGVQLKAIIYPDEDELVDFFGKENPEEGEVTDLIRREIRDLGKENLETHQRVRDFELRWEPFPRTPTQKIKRHLFDRDVHSIGEDE